MAEEIIQVVEINCETGEQIYRPMTAEELAQREADRVEWEAQEIIKNADKERVVNLRASAKAKLIAGEPLTEDEASVLII